MPELYWYKAEVIHLVDGDTADLRVDLGFDTHREVRARLADIDTPEIHGVKHSSEEYEKGMEAINFVEEWLENHDHQVLVKTYQDKGNFGRWIAEIWSPSGEEKLNDLLLKTGHAEPYE